MYLAALLAATPFSELRDPSRAQVLIEEMFAGVKDDSTAYEIRAAAAANSGNFPEALASENTAIRRAVLLSWDSARLRERLAYYESKQPWHGDLLGL